MQKFLSVMLSVFFFFIITNCSRQTIKGEPTTLEEMNGKVLGVLVSPVVVTPKMVQAIQGMLPSEVRSFPSANELFAALKSKRVDAISSLDEVNRFLMSTGDNLGIIPIKDPNRGLRMIMRDTDTAIRDELNRAIAKLKEEGILDELYKKYITNATIETLKDAPVEIPEISGTDTILIGINGDLPPFDYVTPDGKSSGYNVALAVEISQVLGRNIKFVQIPSEARFSALLAKNARRMDVFFWYYETSDVQGLIMTDAYAEVKESVLVRK
jgi:ABC-type amino acid transport substrate-binding protein